MNLFKAITISTLALTLVASTAFAQGNTSGQGQGQEGGQSINTTGTTGAGSTTEGGSTGGSTGTAGSGANATSNGSSVGGIQGQINTSN